MKYKKGLFIFRRDLRLDDNTTLHYALQNCAMVIPCFIFDSRQITKKNTYFSCNAFQFMIESLEDLNKQLQEKSAKLYFFYGIAEKIIEKLLEQEKIDAVFCNKDYTPFSLKRDEAIKKICQKSNVDFILMHDALLINPDEIKTGNNTAFQIFTPFYKKANTMPITFPLQCTKNNFYTEKISSEQSQTILKKLLKTKNKFIAVHGGMQHALRILTKLKKFKNYAQEHDFPSIETTRLSAHNKFGTVSIRTVYHAIAKTLKKNHPLIRQLYWRDFFTYVAYYSPFVFGHSFKQKYDALAWSTDKKKFQQWCQGKTGFPLVDAGMRELNNTGFMHNRARLVVASFLVKDLHINWQWGEQYFAQQLVDYDPCVNNGNWQWVASTGTDAQPYFRIFNPWLQQKKFDPQCLYIKQWIPELRIVAPKIIHTWYNQKIPSKYPKPMVDHKIESKKAKALYKAI